MLFYLNRSVCYTLNRNFIKHRVNKTLRNPNEYTYFSRLVQKTSVEKKPQFLITKTFKYFNQYNA